MGKQMKAWASRAQSRRARRFFWIVGCCMYRLARFERVLFGRTHGFLEDCYVVVSTVAPTVAFDIPTLMVIRVVNIVTFTIRLLLFSGCCYYCCCSYYNQYFELCCLLLPNTKMRKRLLDAPKLSTAR